MPSQTLPWWVRGARGTRNVPSAYMNLVLWLLKAAQNRMTIRVAGVPDGPLVTVSRYRSVKKRAEAYSQYLGCSMRDGRWLAHNAKFDVLKQRGRRLDVIWVDDCTPQKLTLLVNGK